MSGPTIVEKIGEAEKRLARAEHDAEELRVERNVTEGRFTGDGTMVATPHGQWVIDDLNRQHAEALEVCVQARAELNRLLAEFDACRIWAPGRDVSFYGSDPRLWP